MYLFFVQIIIVKYWGRFAELYGKLIVLICVWIQIKQQSIASL